MAVRRVVSMSRRAGSGARTGWGRAAVLAGLAGSVVAAATATATVGAGVGASASASAADGSIPSAWSPPAVIHGSTRTGTFPAPGAGLVPSLAFARGGTGVVAFSGGGLTVPPPPALPTGSVLTLAAPIAADAVGTASRLTPSLVTRLVGDGASSLLAILSTSGAGSAAGRPTVAGLTTSPGPTLGSPRVLGPASESAAGLAADARGDAGVLLAQPCQTGAAGCRGARLLLAVRPGGGSSFTKPALLAGAANRMTPALAIGPSGDVLVAWGAGSGRTAKLLARFRFRSGRVGPVKTLGPALGAGTIRAALGAGDRAVVGWGTGSAGIDGAVGPTTFRVALARSGGQFAPARTVDRWTAPGTTAGTPIEVALTSSKTGLVAWQGRTPAGFVICVARTSGQGVGTPQIVSGAAPPDAMLDSLATGPGGSALVLWSRQAAGGVAGGISAAAAATPSAAFSAPELVAPGVGTYGAKAALDPVTRRALAVWYTANEESVGYAVRAAL